VSELEIQKERVATCLEAMRHLYDAQNGPPLLTPRHVEFWQTAMRYVAECLTWEREYGLCPECGQHIEREE
jgi:hypothetical protein